MKNLGFILTVASILQGLIYVHAQSGTIDCSNPAGTCLVGKLWLLATIYTIERRKYHTSIGLSLCRREPYKSHMLETVGYQPVHHRLVGQKQLQVFSRTIFRPVLPRQRRTRR